MAQQTAVEWLMQKIEKTLPNFIQAWGVEFEQAKQMEKEQITDSYIMGSYDMAEKKFTPEQYYNETYGKE